MKKLLKNLKEAKKRSTRVNYWYNHGEDGTIRGPFNRWLKVSEVDGNYKNNVASVKDDAIYCAAAMNYLPVLIEEIERLQKELENIKIDNILLKD